MVVPVGHSLFSSMVSPGRSNQRVILPDAISRAGRRQLFTVAWVRRGGKTERREDGKTKKRKDGKAV
jgi:hypothetical protein